MMIMIIMIPIKNDNKVVSNNSVYSSNAVIIWTSKPLPNRDYNNK